MERRREKKTVWRKRAIRIHFSINNCEMAKSLDRSFTRVAANKHLNLFINRKYVVTMLRSAYSSTFGTNCKHFIFGCYTATCQLRINDEIRMDVTALGVDRAIYSSNCFDNSK